MNAQNNRQIKYLCFINLFLPLQTGHLNIPHIIPSLQMSAVSSKRSTKPNITIANNNNHFSQKSEQQTKKTDQQLSSSKIQKQKVKFQKTQQKPKKNLTKYFETFNHHNEQSQTNSNRSHIKVGKNQKKQKQQENQQQMTTQTKAQFQEIKFRQKQKSNKDQSQISKKTDLRTTDKKSIGSLKKSKSKSPIDKISRSRQSSSEAQMSYSKFCKLKGKSSSKGSNQKKPRQEKDFSQRIEDNNFQTKKSCKLSSETDLKGAQRKKMHDNISSKGKQRHYKQFELQFPQMVTQSQSMYPCSSYPNTGKQSQNNRRNLNQRSQNSANISQEQEQLQQLEMMEGSYLNDQQGDYIQQSWGNEYQNSSYLNHNKSAASFRRSQTIASQKLNGLANTSPTGYCQLPDSYLVAMSILQDKLKEQQLKIGKLNTKVNKEKQGRNQLQQQILKLQQQLGQQKQITAQKDMQIKFLKGYLDEQKLNNRQALRQVAKNVYQRSISKTQTNTQNGKNTRKYQKYTPNKENQNYRFDTTQKNEHKSQLQRQINLKQADQTNIRQAEQTKLRLAQQNLDEMKEMMIKQQNLLSERQRLDRLQQEIIRIDRTNKNKNDLVQITDQISRKSRRSANKYNYQIIDPKPIQSFTIESQLYPRTAKKPRFGQYHDKTQRQQLIQLSGSYSDGKRLRSITTAAKNAYPDRSYTNRPTQNVPLQFESPPSFSYSHNKQPSQYLIDPVLQKFINSKSANTANYNQIEQELKMRQVLISDKKNKQTVSKMRELMRSEKQLVTLNYRMEAIEKKIIDFVKTTKKQASTNNQLLSKRSLQDQVKQKYVLQDLQSQYNQLRKQFEIKDLKVKHLKSIIQPQT